MIDRESPLGGLVQRWRRHLKLARGDERARLERCTQEIEEAMQRGGGLAVLRVVDRWAFFVPRTSGPDRMTLEQCCDDVLELVGMGLLQLWKEEETPGAAGTAEPAPAATDIFGAGPFTPSECRHGAQGDPATARIELMKHRRSES